MVLHLWGTVLIRNKQLVVDNQLLDILNPWVRTFGMLNSPSKSADLLFASKRNEEFCVQITISGRTTY